MATPRCVPGFGPDEEWDDGVVEFADGKRTVPEQYRRYLKPGQRQCSQTYQDWVHQTFDAERMRNVFQGAVRQMIRGHFGR